MRRGFGNPVYVENVRRNELENSIGNALYCNSGDVNVKVDENGSEEVDFKEVSQERALEILKVSVFFLLLC